MNVWTKFHGKEFYSKPQMSTLWWLERKNLLNSERFVWEHINVRVKFWWDISSWIEMVNRPTDKRQSKTAVPRAASKAKNYKQLLGRELREQRKKEKGILAEIFKRSYLLSSFTSDSTPAERCHCYSHFPCQYSTWDLVNLRLRLRLR